MERECKTERGWMYRVVCSHGCTGCCLACSQPPAYIARHFAYVSLTQMGSYICIYVHGKGKEDMLQKGRTHSESRHKWALIRKMTRNLSGVLPARHPAGGKGLGGSLLSIYVTKKKDPRKISTDK